MTLLIYKLMFYSVGIITDVLEIFNSYMVGKIFNIQITYRL